MTQDPAHNKPPRREEDVSVVECPRCYGHCFYDVWATADGNISFACKCCGASFDVTIPRDVVPGGTCNGELDDDYEEVRE